MPFHVLVLLILAVIADAGLTVALAHLAGWPLPVVANIALAASLLPGLRRWT